MLTFIYAPLRRRLPGMLVALAVLLSSVLVLAAPADLDPTFDGDGIVITPMGARSNAIHALAIQADDKLVVAGFVRNGNLSVFGLARYKADGGLDSSFDSDGKVTTLIDTGSDTVSNIPQALAIQADGKLVVAGHAFNGSNYDFALVRYNTDGSLDSSFDGDGIVTTAISIDHDYAYSLAIQADGKLVVAGAAYTSNTNPNFALVRYNADGSLDSSFDGDGKVITPISTGTDGISDLVIQADGKLIVAGSSWNGSNHDFALARYNADGSLDSSFDGDGIVTTSNGINHEYAHGLAIQTDGKLAVAGYTENASDRDFMLARYNTDGSLDISFDGDGTALTPIGTSYDEAHDLIIQRDGKLVVSGQAWNGSNYDFALARYNADGSLDTSFSGDGKAITPIGVGDDTTSELALQADGRLVVVGGVYNGSNHDFALARYQGGSLPTISTISNQKIDEDSTTGALSFSIGDLETAPESLTVSSNSSNATLVPEANIVLGGSGANRTVTITPAANHAGSVTITLTVTDEVGNTVQTSFTLTVDPVNDPPSLSNLSKNGSEDSPLSFGAGDFSAHFADADGDTLTTIQVTALPAHGTLMLGSAPVTLNQEIAVASLSQLSFEPDANWNGSTSFGWSASDGTAYAEPALVTIVITAVNDAPSFITGPSQTVVSDAGPVSVSGWASGFNPGPADEASQTLLGYTVASNSAPELFSVAPAIDASGALTFTPAPGAIGSATIQVVVQDSGGTAGGGQDTSAVRTFTITITDASEYSVYLPLVRSAVH